MGLKTRLLRLLPDDSRILRHLSPDGKHLNATAALWFRNVRRGVLGLVIAGGGVYVAGLTKAPEILGGALLGWGGALVVWALSEARDWDDEVRQDLRREVEREVLHHHLNVIGRALGLPPIERMDQEELIRERAGYLAHLRGVEELGDYG